MKVTGGQASEPPDPVGTATRSAAARAGRRRVSAASRTGAAHL